MPGILWLSHERVAQLMPQQYVTPARLKMLQKPILWVRKPFAHLQVGDPMPRQRGTLQKIARQFRKVRRALLDRPSSFLQALLQFTIGFGLGRRFATIVKTPSRRAWFYLTTQATFGKKEGYMLGGVHMGVLRGDVAKFGLKEQVSRTTERELLKEALRRVTKKQKYQMPSAPGLPGLGWAVPLIAGGVSLAVSLVSAGSTLLLGESDTESVPAPPPLTSIPDSAKQFTMPLGAWWQTGNAVWGVFLGGIVLGRLLAQRND